MAMHTSTTAGDRAVFTFGQNSYGELAQGDLQERHIPTLVDFCQGKNIVQVVAGNEHTLVLTDTGEVYSAGYNDSGQCGQGNTSRVTSLKLVDSLREKKITYLQSTNGCEHVFAVTAEGDLFSFGYNARGQLGHGDVTSVAVPRSVQALAGKRVVSVGCSYYHSVVACENDELYSFGRNDHGQLGHGDHADRLEPQLVVAMQGKKVTSIGCGQYHTVLCTDSGEVYSMGKNDYGQLGLGMSTMSQDQPRFISELQAYNVVKVASGYYHSIALTDDHHVFCWGRNDYGQLGAGDTHNYRTPHLTEALEGKGVGQVAAGCYHTFALAESGYLYGFGRNNHGQLGDGTTTDRTSPRLIEKLMDKKAAQVAGGFYHTVVLTGPPLAKSSVPGNAMLNKDFRQLLNNSTHSDVTFIVEDKPLYAHRCLIMARCEPLERMLDGPMREGHEEQVTIGDIGYSCFLALLEFLYTDSVEGLDPEIVELDFALDLLAVADQFLVEPLKQLCENAIQKSIRVENVALMFQTAAARQAFTLKKTCFDFIMKNFGKVIGTVAFSELPSHLLQEILFAASERGVYLRN
eukprot:GILJ01003191.1.p1 GENE.GILJ01003191.1~~GILJ01003191.1.p1  ORF type:complete len:574 (+),score=72.27 GILJ01003191.1:35-1756(+)